MTMNREGTVGNLSAEPTPPAVVAAAAQEALVSDPRAGLTPAQLVERKLVSLLPGAQLPVSRLQGPGPRRALS
jgi:hypothetical protein